MKILIITYYWPPAGGSGVQRWLKFVKYLQDFGIEPIVYTVANPNYAILDHSLEEEVPASIKILKQPIKEPNQILSLFSKKSKKISAGFLDSNPSLFGKISQYIRANYFIPDARKFWIKPSVNYLKTYLKKNSIDAIITTGPPHSLHLIGLQLKQKLGMKWIADFRDPWTSIDYFHQLPLTKRALQKHKDLEKEVLRKADQILVVGNTMKEEFVKYNTNIEVITNGFDDISTLEKTNLDSKFTLVHIGMLNADRNPKILWKVLSEIIKENNSFAHDFQCKLIGKVANEVIESISKHKLSSFIQLIEYQPHHKVVEFQKNAQLLLLLVNNVPNAKGIITGKIFEYLQAKRPILAIAPRDGDLAKILKNTNSGKLIEFEDDYHLKNSILEFYDAYKNGTLAVTSRNIEQYHRRELTGKLANILKKLI